MAVIAKAWVEAGGRLTTEHGQKRSRQNALRSRQRIQNREVVSTVYRQQASRKTLRTSP
jgi:hypothetical protein